MKNIKNYSVKFYHIFIVFLFVSLSFQWGFAQAIVDGKIKLHFEKVEKTKAEMDVILAAGGSIYLQVYAEYSDAFSVQQVKDMFFTSATFSWVFCDEAGVFLTSASPDVKMLAHPNMKCPNGDLAPPDNGAARYGFAQHGCPEFGYYATVISGGSFGDKLKPGTTHIVEMGSIGFKLINANGFFVKMENTDSQIDKSFGSIIYNHETGLSGSVVWDNSGIFDWGQAGPDRFDISQVGGVVVKKGFKNKSV